MRHSGWSPASGQPEDGVRSVAVPVHGAAGRVVAAINTSGPRDPAYRS